MVQYTAALKNCSRNTRFHVKKKWKLYERENMGRKHKVYLDLSLFSALDLGHHLEVKAFYLFPWVAVPLMSLKLYQIVV